MWRSHRAEVIKKSAYVLGVANLIILIFGVSNALTLSVAILLAPFLLATALQLTVFLACAVLSYALSNSWDRAELLASTISAMLPRGTDERYEETIIAEIREARAEWGWWIALTLTATAPGTRGDDHNRPPDARRITLNLIATAPRAIYEAWVLVPLPLWQRWRPRRR